jgi:tetratricopeptide (TPR) repeat protein
VAAVVICALGMGAKEVMATAPIVVLLYDRAFLSGSFRETFRRRGALYLGLAATWAVLAAIMLLCEGPASAGFGIKEVTSWQYALTQPGVILYYLGLSFWPRSLCLDYSWPLATKFWQIAPQATALAALLAATAWAAVRRPALGFLGAWFFLILAPTSSIMPIKDACFEHRMYLSLAAVVAGAVIAACALIRRLVRQSAFSDHSATIAAVVLALTVAAALGCVTFRRNRDYRSEISIWEDAAHKRENNARAQMSLGVAYFDERRFDEAMRCYNRGIELNPEYPKAHYDRAIALARINDHAGAIRDLDQAISLQPDFAAAYVQRGIEYSMNNRFPETIQDCSRAIELKPDSVEAFVNRAYAYIELRRYDLALSDCNRAIELKPGYAAAWDTRAIVCFQMKEYDKSWRDVAAFQKLGGQPNPEFLQALKQASGRSE